MNSLFILCLYWSSRVAAQSATGSSNSSAQSGTPNPSATFASLPSITPFQIPPEVLQGLGLPLVIPSIEQAPRPPNAKGSGERAAPRPAYNPPWSAPRQPPGLPVQYGTQGGLPYDRSKICISNNAVQVN
jgi:hypothetical protein